MTLAPLGLEGGAPLRGDAYVPLDCAKCPLAAGRTRVVPAEGARRPLAFFVGEGPGPEEDATGRPFVGRAGMILRRALAEAGWHEDEVWITNIVKCFPHEKDGDRRRIRKPNRGEVDACRGHLVSEVAALRPRLLVALGRTAAEAVAAGRVGPLREARRRPLELREDLGDAPLVATYHPSGLHYGHASVEEFTDDLRRARVLALQGRGAP